MFGCASALHEMHSQKCSHVYSHANHLACYAYEHNHRTREKDGANAANNTDTDMTIANGTRNANVCVTFLMVFRLPNGSLRSTRNNRCSHSLSINHGKRTTSEQHRTAEPHAASLEPNCPIEGLIRMSEVACQGLTNRALAHSHMSAS